MIRFIWLLLCVSCTTQAVEINRLEVRRLDNQYRIDSVLILDAPSDRVWQHLIDYAQLHQLSPTLITSEVLPPVNPQPPTTVRVLLVNRLCILGICKDLRQRVQMNHAVRYHLTALLEPEGSDFVAATMQWQLKPIKQQTELYFAGEWLPDFWVPPVVGTWLVKRALTEKAILLGSGLEQKAKQ